MYERWGAGVETQKNVRGEIGGWGRVPFHENYAPSLSTILRRGVGFMKFLENGSRPQPPTSPAAAQYIDGTSNAALDAFKKSHTETQKV